MKGVIIPKPKEVRVLEFPNPEPGPTEVVVRVKASAICRSDLSIYYGMPVVGKKTVPVIPGHEPSGVVEKLGSLVKHVNEGDRVAIYLAIGDGYCPHCRKGDIVFCPNVQILGFDVDGGDAEYVVVPARNVLPIPNAMDFGTAALSTDAVGTLYHAAKRARISGDDMVAIFGMGPMGISGLLVSKSLGAQVIAVDINKKRLSIAKDFGADHVIDSLTEDPIKMIKEVTEGIGVDVAIDCSGNPIAENNALDSAKKGGKVIFIGENKEVKINPSDQMIRKQLLVMGSWYFNIGEYDKITKFIVKKNLPVEKLITHRFKLKEAQTAFELFDKRETIKAIFVP